MQHWKRIVTFVLALAMLASLMLPAAANESNETITLHQEKNVDLGDSGSVIFSFTPTEEGYYSFRSTDYDRDPKAAVYDSDMNQLYFDDDNGDGWNFEISWYAEAGQTYYLEARGTGAYTAYVVIQPHATSLELTCDAETGYPDAGRYYYLNYALLPEGCFYEAVTFSSSDEQVVSVNDYGEYFMLSPGTAVITATSESGLTATCTITVREPETLLRDQSVTVYEEEGERRMLFVPEASGWYGFYSTGEELDTVGRLLDADGVELVFNDDGGEGYNFLIKAWLEAGSSYTLRADWSNYHEGRTAQLQVTALSTPQSLKLEYTSYTGYVTQRQTLSPGYSPLLSIPELLTWTSSDESVVTVDENGEITIQGAGTAVVTATSESGLTASCSVTGKMAPLVTCEDVIIQYFDGKYDLYKFIPETSGWYGFYSTGDHGNPYGIIFDKWFSWIAENYYNGIDHNFLVKAYLEAGEVYYLKPAADGGENTEFYEARIAPLTAASGLYLSSETLSKRVGDRMRMEAYTIPLLSISESVTWSSSDEAVAIVDSYGDVTCLSEGTAVITAASENGLTASCTVTVKDLEIILCDEPLTVYEEDEACRLRFIPEASGWYGFYSTGDIDTYGYILDKDGNELGYSDHNGYDNNFLAKAWLEAGNTYILEAYWYNYGNGLTAQLQVSTLSAPESLVLNFSNIDAYAGTEHWMVCLFAPLLSISEDLTWTSSDETVATVNEDGCVTVRGAGTAVITVTSASGLTASCTVTGREAPLVTCGDVIVKNGNGDYELYKFIPETSGWYGFYSTGKDSDPYGYILDRWFNWIEDNNDNGSDNNFLVKAYLDAGEVYYLYPFWSSWDSESSYEARIAPLTEATGIELSQQELNRTVGTRFTLQAYTTPLLTIPEEIVWSSSDEAVATVDSNGEVFCQNPGTTVITVTTAGGHQAACTITVKEIPTISLDQILEVDVAEGICRHRFTAPEDGWYSFCSLNNTLDTYGTLYDENGNYLTENDDGADNNNFLITYKLQAGETCILESRPYSIDATEGSYQLQVTRSPEATELHLSTNVLTGFVGRYDGLGTYLVPAGAIPQPIVWTSSDESVVTVNEDGYLNYIGIGTAVITATSSSGLTATCTVTVQHTQQLYLNKTETLDVPNKSYYFIFVPETTGWYGFHTVGSSEMWAALRNESDEELTFTESVNQMMRGYLEAGKTYAVYCRFYEGDGVTLTPISLVQPTQMVPETEQMALYPQCTYFPRCSFYPYESYSENVTWSSNNTDVVMVYDGREIMAIAPGTAQVTATSESGLTATITVVVAEPPVGADDYGVAGYNLLWQLKNGILTFIGSGDMRGYLRMGQYSKVEMPEGLTSIGNQVFMNQNLGEMVIPSTVTKVDYGVFRYSNIAGIHFKGSAPEFHEYAFDDVTATAFYPAEDPTWTEEVRQDYGGDITWVPYYTDEPDAPTEPDGSQGVTVSGSITTGADGETTVELLSNGNPVATAVVSGKTGSYSFTNVAPGTYTLRVSKVNHVSREYELTVASDSVTQDVKIHLIGDINGDGRVTVADVSKAYAHVKKATLLTGYEFEAADVSGDGRLSVADVSKLYAHTKKTTTLW